jgi:hypothetical protein
MIYNENPGDQIYFCIRALSTLTAALETCDNEGLASTCQMIEYGVKDAVERIDAQHKAERERFCEAALHVSLAKNGAEYLSPSEREQLIEQLKQPVNA